MTPRQSSGQARQLPSKPSLEHLRKEAKALLKTHKKGDPSCSSVLRHLHQFESQPDDAILKADVSLQEVQLALSLDYGFRSWAELKAHVGSLSESNSWDLAEPDKPVCSWTDLSTFLATLRPASRDYGEPQGYIQEIGSPRLYADGGGHILDATFILLNILDCSKGQILGTHVSSILTLQASGQTKGNPCRCKILRLNDNEKTASGAYPGPAGHPGGYPGDSLYIDMMLRRPKGGSFAVRVNIRHGKWKTAPAMYCLLDMVSGPGGETGVPWPYPDMDKRTDRADKLPWDTSEPGQRLKEAGAVLVLATSRNGTILESSIPMLLALNTPESQLVGRSIWEILCSKEPGSIQDFVDARIDDDLHGKPARGMDVEVRVQRDRSFVARLGVCIALWKGQDALCFQLRPISEMGRWSA